MAQHLGQPWGRCSREKEEREHEGKSKKDEDKEEEEEEEEEDGPMDGLVGQFRLLACLDSRR